MIAARAIGRPFLAALLLAAAPVGAAAQEVLRLSDDTGAAVIEVAVPDGARWCLSWNHSVTGGAVADCFENVAGRMVLIRSYLHDFAAGLGTLAGRGRLRSATDGGYWIEDMNDPIADNTLVLRVGAPAVDHRLQIEDIEYALSDIAANQRLTLRLVSPTP